MWSNNNRACTTMWRTLIGLQQLTRRDVFKLAGDKPLRNLPYYAQDGGDGVVRTRAEALALQIDGVFVELRGAKYEENVDQKQAVEAMVEILIDREKSVADLAATADDKYFFFQENE